LCPTIPLCLLLETLDGITGFGRIVPTGSGPLPQHPSTKGTNAKAQFSIREHLQQFSVYGVPFLLQGLEVPCDFHPPLKQLVWVQIR
jgi:hypothetical protein